jgi:6-phosphofructokinase 1
MSRITDLTGMTTERQLLRHVADQKTNFDTMVRMLAKPERSNSVGEDMLGLYRRPAARKAVIADMELLESFVSAGLPVPSFLEAGPRETLRFDPQRVRAAVVTTGGLAPGLHCVVHSIVKRHAHTYSLAHGFGKVFGVYDSFKGLCDLPNNLVELTPDATEEWLDHGGSRLGNVRYYHEGQKGPESMTRMVDVISQKLSQNNIDILYVIGGDGSLRVAHQIAEASPNVSVVGVPKTMDNDILWVWQSFGFDTAVERATRVINTLRSEAESTRRICLIELFGAESGFVAANASLASGHVDLVLIPEVFSDLNGTEALTYLEQAVAHVEWGVCKDPHHPHAVVVVAEGVGTVFAEKGIVLGDANHPFILQLKGFIEARVHNAHGDRMEVLLNQPRHHIRAVPANAHDQIYCERLGALAVDNALAGYTDFMISQWLTEYVLVPLELVSQGNKKSIPIHGMFWKQVVSSTGQKLSPAERPNPAN